MSPAIMCLDRLHFRVKSWERVGSQTSLNRAAKSGSGKERHVPRFLMLRLSLITIRRRVVIDVMQTLLLTSAVLLFSFLPFVPPAYSQPIDTARVRPPRTRPPAPHRTDP